MWSGSLTENRSYLVVFILKTETRVSCTWVSLNLCSENTGTVSMFLCHVLHTPVLGDNYYVMLRKIKSL